MQKRSIIYLCIVILLSMVILNSCGTDGTGTDLTLDTTQSNNNDVEETTIAEIIVNENFDGYEFRILTHIVGTKIFNNEHIVVESEIGEPLNDSIYQRNRNVEEAFNVVITEIISTSVKNSFQNSVMAGDDSFDIAVIQSGNIPDYKYLTDFFTVNTINLDKPWWDQNVISEQSIGGKLFYTYSDMLITHIDPAIVMFFNQKLAVDNNVPDLYDMVRTGTWTMDEMYEVSKGTSQDLNGDNEYDDRDLYPYTSLTQNSYNVWMPAGGAAYMAKDENDYPYLTIGEEKFSDVFDKVNSILTQPNFVYNPGTMANTGGDGDSAVFRLFTSNQTFLFTHGLGSVQMYRDMESDYGVIPVPKYSESQERYYTGVNSMKYLLIPITNSDLDRTGYILESMSEQGSSVLRPSYYSTMLLNKYMRDEESIEMLDEYIIPYLTTASKQNEITAVFNSFRTMCSSNDRNLASFIAANESSFEAEIQKVIDTLNES